MSNFLILPGRYLNILEGCASIVAGDPEPGYDEKNVANNVPSHAFKFKFDGPGVNEYLLADLNRVGNGDMETWVVTTCPYGWYKYNTVTREGGVVHGGTYSCKMASIATIFRTIWVPAGWEMTVDCWLYGDGAGKKTYGAIHNLLTDKWLKSDGTWASGVQLFGEQTAAAWVQKKVEFVVEDYATCGYQHLVPLRLEFASESGSGGGYVDDISMWPHWNFASIHGHNIPPNIVLRVQSDDAIGFPSGTNQVLFSKIQPAMFGRPAAIVKERCVRLYLAGTVHLEHSAYIGEWVLGQYQTLGKGHDHGPIHTKIMPVTKVSDASRTARSDRSHRRLQLDFTSLDTAYETMCEMIERASGGADPIVIVPFDNESTVMFGHFPVEQSTTRLFLQHYSYSLEFQEMAFPFTFHIPYVWTDPF